MEYSTEKKNVKHSAEKIFNTLKDFSKLKKSMREAEKNGFTISIIDNDSCSIQLPMGQNIELYYRDRIPYSSLEIANKASSLPLSLVMRILLEETAPETTQMSVNIVAELPAFIETMIRPKIQEGVDKLANMLTMLPYDKL